MGDSLPTNSLEASRSSLGCSQFSPSPRVLTVLLLIGRIRHSRLPPPNDLVLSFDSEATLERPDCKNSLVSLSEWRARHLRRMARQADHSIDFDEATASAKRQVD